MEIFSDADCWHKWKLNRKKRKQRGVEISIFCTGGGERSPSAHRSCINSSVATRKRLLSEASSMKIRRWKWDETRHYCERDDMRWIPDSGSKLTKSRKNSFCFYCLGMKIINYMQKACAQEVVGIIIVKQTKELPNTSVQCSNWIVCLLTIRFPRIHPILASSFGYEYDYEIAENIQKLMQRICMVYLNSCGFDCLHVSSLVYLFYW